MALSAKTARRAAERFNEAGLRLSDKDDWDRAIEAHKRAVEMDAGWATPWYNMGLLHKYRGEWKQSLYCNQKAASLEPDHEGAIWNTGIAATALGEWKAARDAWKQYGITGLTGFREPRFKHSSSTPIRLHGEDGAEVVWTERIDPARAIIRSVPFPESGYRFGDLLLHDGFPNGYRMSRGREVPIFDTLTLLKRSPFTTFVMEVENFSEEASEELDRRMFAANMATDSWSRVRVLCKACSEGRAHDEHEGETVEETLIGLAAEDEEAMDKILDQWKADFPDVKVEGEYLGLTPDQGAEEFHPPPRELLNGGGDDDEDET